MARDALSTGIKIAAWLAAGIALLIVIAAVALAIFFDANEYKPEIIALVKEKTGRDLAIPGDLEAHVFPRPGASFGSLELANAKGFGPAPFARVESGSVRLKLLPLIKKQVELSHVAVRGLDLNLSKAKSGKTNWDDLKPRDQDAQASGNAPRIGAIRISDSKVTWDDQLSGKRAVFEKLDLRAGALNPKEDLPIAFESDFVSEDVAGHLELDAVANFDHDARQYRLRGKLLKAKLTGEIGANAEADGNLFADLDDASFRIEDALVTATVAGKQIPEKIDLELAVREAALEAETVTVEGFQLRGPGIALAANLQGKGDASIGKLELSEFNPREVMQRIGVKLPQTADPNVLDKASLSVEIKRSSKNLDLSKLNARVDDSALTGHITITNFSDPVVAFALTIDKIDLDRYRSRTSPDRGGALPSLEWLRNRNIQGTLRIGALKVVDERATDFLVAVDTRE